MSKDPEPLQTTRDVQPLAEAPPVELQRAQAARLLRTWKTPIGWRYWSSVNNTDVGLWYTGMTLFFLLFGGVLALLMRIQLAKQTTISFPPNSTIKSSPCMVR
jgi:cytochrome c oxidase subunit I+III